MRRELGKEMLTPEREKEIRAWFTKTHPLMQQDPLVLMMQDLLAELDRVRLQDRKYQFIDDMLGDACRRGKLLETERDQLRAKLEIAIDGLKSECRCIPTSRYPENHVCDACKVIAKIRAINE